jgi:hypothetical protein
MKSSGTIYVGATFALLAAYFSYQWWFNPSRALKRQMGEVAAALSVPASESDVARSRGWRGSVAIWLTTFGSAPETPRFRPATRSWRCERWKPLAGGIDVRFVDTQVFIDSESQARAYMSVEVATPIHGAEQPPSIARKRLSRLENRIASGRLRTWS